MNHRAAEQHGGSPAEPRVGDLRAAAVPSPVSRPGRELAAAQGEWLRAARARLLRRAGIARRRLVLELGAGWGFASVELARRSAGRVVALDLEPRPADAELPANVEWVVGDAEQLPFVGGTFDLVFAQLTLLWTDAPRVIAEAFRVLEPGGVLAVIEPDYGGLMEHPPEVAVKELWIEALERAGADPLVGRKLPGWLAAAGFQQVQTQFLDRLEPPDPLRFELLAELPLDDDQQAMLDRAARLNSDLPDAIAHLPCWLVTGSRPNGAGD